jgi:hypothetical protein
LRQLKDIGELLHREVNRTAGVGEAMLETPQQEEKICQRKQGFDLHEQELIINEIDVVCQRTVDSFLET